MPKVTCLDENTVVAFFEGRLPQTAGAELDEHLAACESCRRLLAEYAAIAAPANATVPGSGSAPHHERPSEAEIDRTALGRRISLAQAEQRAGSVLCNKWRIDRVIGIGGMAQVFEATHRNGRKVAVKILRPELVVEPVLVERFLREGYVANKIGHPGAVAILDDDIADDGAPFLVMELLRGRTLSQRLRETGPLCASEALEITLQVLDVLRAAHERGVVHRDIKPDNLFETHDHTIKVLDFGIARLRERMGTEGATQSGMALGTVGYMSPEQARGLSAAVDAQSDIWAVGATLFTLLTGRVLHDAPTTNQALLLAMTEPVAPMATLVPELSETIAGLLDAALGFEKPARFADCRAMRQAARTALESVRASSPALRPSNPPAVRSQNGTLLGMASSVSAIAEAPPPPAQESTDAASRPPARLVRSRFKWRLAAAAVVVGGLAVAYGVAKVANRQSPIPASAAGSASAATAGAQLAAKNPAFDLAAARPPLPVPAPAVSEAGAVRPPPSKAAGAEPGKARAARSRTSHHAAPRTKSRVAREPHSATSSRVAPAAASTFRPEDPLAPRE